MTESPIEGVVVRSTPRHTDESGMSQSIVADGQPPIDLGLSRMSWSRRATGTITAWQLHPDRWDWWMVIHGDLKIVLHDLRDGSRTHGVTWEVFAGDDAEPCIIGVPPGIAHGYKVLRGPVELLSLLSRSERPDSRHPEEIHMPHDDAAIGYDWTRTTVVRS